MFKILGENPIFHQWDLDQKLIVEDSSVTQVHYSNGSTDSALVCEVYEQDGLKLVDVPNILLQKSLSIMAYAYCTNYTKQSVIFKVIARSKPDSYIYTETEVKTFAQLENDIEAVEERVKTLEEKPAPVVEQSYNAESENAQSGKAVAEALTTVAEKSWTLLKDIKINKPVIKIDEGDFGGAKYDELWIEGTIVWETDYGSTSKTVLTAINCTFQATSHTEYWDSITNGGTHYIRAHAYRTPSGYAVYDTVHSSNYYLSANAKQTAGSHIYILRAFDCFMMSTHETAIRFGVGTNLKVWGR